MPSVFFPLCSVGCIVLRNMAALYIFGDIICLLLMCTYHLSLLSCSLSAILCTLMLPQKCLLCILLSLFVGPHSELYLLVIKINQRKMTLWLPILFSSSQVSFPLNNMTWNKHLDLRNFLVYQFYNKIADMPHLTEHDH